MATPIQRLVSPGGEKEPESMMRRPRFAISLLILLMLLEILLSGCAKKIVKAPLMGPPVKDPIARLLESFSAADRLQAKTSIRIDTAQKGKEISYRLSGTVLFEKPQKLRILGYYSFPLPMDLFDALYREGALYLLVPQQKKAFTGALLEFNDLLEKTDIRISTESTDGAEVPNRIRIDLVEAETRIELRLREISMNATLPDGAFSWWVPDDVENIPLAWLLKRLNTKEE